VLYPLLRQRFRMLPEREGTSVSSSVMVCFENDGVVQYPADLDPANPGADHGGILSLLGSRLDVVARRLGVRPLSDFVFADPDMLEAILADLDGPRRASVERLLTTQQQWHPVVEGRHTTASLLSYLEHLDRSTAVAQHPELLLGGTLEPLLADLRALDHVLSGNDSRFHLEAL
jgi:hypothetical protein